MSHLHETISSCGAGDLLFGSSQKPGPPLRKPNLPNWEMRCRGARDDNCWHREDVGYLSGALFSITHLHQNHFSPMIHENIRRERGSTRILFPEVDRRVVEAQVAEVNVVILVRR